MAERRVLVKSFAGSYQKATKKEKSQILDRFVAMSGYHRSYGGLLLRQHGKKTYWKEKKKVFVGDARGRVRRQRRRKYGQEVVRALVQVWQTLDYLCGKRLVAILPEVVERLEQLGELRLDQGTRQRLSEISAATIDRLLRAEKKKFQLKGRSGTKPGTLRKAQIPLKRFADWRQDEPGFVEIDLVAHEGGNSRGDFCQTLNVTDVATGWTELRAVPNKAQIWVFEALKAIQQQAPFSWRGIASDNVLTEESRANFADSTPCEQSKGTVADCVLKPVGLPLCRETF